MYSFERFVKSNWSLVILSDSGEIIFKSRASALKPLLRYLKSDNPTREHVVIYDKYVGRAAALLMTTIRPRTVFTPIISEGGRMVLDQYEIPFRALQEVKYLMGVASDEMCHWEKLSIGRSPREFLLAIGGK